jgi:hypothetical protein
MDDLGSQKSAAIRQAINAAGARLVEHSDDYPNAVATAIGAGRTELPYNTMLIEWEDRSDGRIFWLIDESAPNSYRIWAAFHYPRAKRTLVFGYPFPASFTASGEALVQRYDGPLPPHLPSFIDSYRPMAGIALCLAMTLHVRGIITRPPAPVSPKLDEARIKNGKPSVLAGSTAKESPTKPERPEALTLLISMGRREILRRFDCFAGAVVDKIGFDPSSSLELI